MVSTTSDAMTFAPLDPIAAAFTVSPKAPFAAAAVIAAVADSDTNPLAAPAHAVVRRVELLLARDVDRLSAHLLVRGGPALDALRGRDSVRQVVAHLRPAPHLFVQAAVFRALDAHQRVLLGCFKLVRRDQAAHVAVE